MKHYVVLADIAVDHAGIDETHVTAVTHSFAEAKKVLAERCAGEKEYAYEHGWTIYIDTDEEFDSGEDGNYAAEHAHFYIEEVNDIRETEDNGYAPSAENGDYSPSDPWNAPGMKMSDFI